MTDVRGARIVRLIEDPLVGGDLLLVAVGLAVWLDFGSEYDNLGRQLWPNAHDPAWWIQKVFRSDIRRYEPSLVERSTMRCSAPMARRTGKCDRNARTYRYQTDWATGEQSYLGACSRHEDWFQAARRTNLAARPDIVPLPYANHGGLLTAHFPELDWLEFWRRLDPSWVEHPERVARPRPRFRLVLGDGHETDAAGRPMLSVVPLDGSR